MTAAPDELRTASVNVWCVWSESGEYEHYSCLLCGIFATADLAAAHAARVDGERVWVEEDVVLNELPPSSDRWRD